MMGYPSPHIARFYLIKSIKTSLVLPVPCSLVMSRALLVCCMTMSPSSCDMGPGDICGMSRELLRTGQIKPNCCCLPLPTLTASPSPTSCWVLDWTRRIWISYFSTEFPSTRVQVWQTDNFHFSSFLGSPCKVFSLASIKLIPALSTPASVSQSRVLESNLMPSGG